MKGPSPGIKTWRPPDACGRAAGYTAVELLGVLAILLIMAAVLVPGIMTSLKRTERQNESVNLATMAEAFRDYVIREHAVPDESNWALAVANELSLPLGKVLQNESGWTRQFLSDPALKIGLGGGSGLPFDQNIQGSVEPVSPRAVLVSSLTRQLPALGTNDFTALWDAAADQVPVHWASDWSKHGKDLKIQRLDLRDLFHHLVLNNIDTDENARFSINEHTAVTLPAGTFAESWYVRFSSVGLRLGDGTLQVQEVLTDDASYVYQNGTWGRKFSQGKITGGDFGTLIDAFLNAPRSPDAVFGADQQAVVNEIYWYMWTYALWAMDGFPKGGSNSDQQVPQFRAVTDAQDRLEDFADNLIQ